MIKSILKKFDDIVREYNSDFKSSEFFDYVEFNHDTYEVGESDDSGIADLYFRLDVDQVIHVREVYSVI